MNSKYITYSRIEFSPKDFKTVHVKIEDIAHALSMLCRYNGHICEFYSVAQHCIQVSKRLAGLGYSVKIQLCGLLHDAAEAYLGDLPAPIKELLYDYKELEKAYQDIIFSHFDLHDEWKHSHSIIKNADNDILEDEQKYYFSNKFVKSIDDSNKINEYVNVSMNDFINLYEYLRNQIS
jgi:5'-deoxynucleotidase YfbR-like HD superfamily hydrolase